MKSKRLAWILLLVGVIALLLRNRSPQEQPEVMITPPPPAKQKTQDHRPESTSDESRRKNSDRTETKEELVEVPRTVKTGMSIREVIEQNPGGILATSGPMAIMPIRGSRTRLMLCLYPTNEADGEMNPEALTITAVVQAGKDGTDLESGTYLLPEKLKGRPFTGIKKGWENLKKWE